jgi:hypothetical protein
LAKGGKTRRSPPLNRERAAELVQRAIEWAAQHGGKLVLRRMKAAGISRQEAAAGVSTWLGHGDGRGTWVELVYGGELLAGGGGHPHA